MSLAGPTSISTLDENQTRPTIMETGAASQADKWALLALAALFAVALISSWQRWTQPIIDHGREMNLPVRILAGEQLYKDVQFLYGPFAPYFNALLYRLFGVHLAVLHASGMIGAALILLMIYWLARQLMSVWEAALATGLVLVICALKFTGNYVQPYAYAALYGLVFALGALVCVARYAQGRGARWICWAGVGGGLALISKPEIAAAAMAAAGVALLLDSLAARRVLWREAGLFAGPVLVIGSLTYGLILSRVPWRVLLENNHILFSNMPPQLVYFNRHISGLSEWPKSLAVAATGLGTLLILAGLSALLGALAAWRQPVAWRSTAKRALGVMLLGAVWSLLVSGVLKARLDASPLIAAPFVLTGVIGVLGWRVWQSRMASGRRLFEHRLLLLITVFGLISIARVFLNVTMSGPYSPFFVPAVIIVYLYLLFRLFPAFFTPLDWLRGNMRRAAMALIAIAMVAVGVKSAQQYRRLQTYEVRARRGVFLTKPALGRPLAEAIRFAEERTSPDDDLLVLPEGTSINFLAERRYPLREEIVHPGFLTGAEEAAAIHDLEARRVPLILLVNQLTPEFRDRVFGEDYNQNLRRWITEHYRLAARFDSDESRGARFGDPQFFILAYERRP